MRGFPKHTNTRRDVEILLNTHPAEMKAFLQKCIEESENWINPVKLADGETGIEDAYSNSYSSGGYSHFDNMNRNSCHCPNYRLPEAKGETAKPKH